MLSACYVALQRVLQLACLMCRSTEFTKLEEGTAVIPTYECCTFRGSLVALDAATGRQIWKTFTISETARQTTRNSAGTQLWGPSGAAVWSTPALDPDRNRLYVTTGDSYSNPPASSSDAVMALAMDTGRIVWTKQTLPGDAWNVACLETGAGRRQCPVTLANGRRALVAGQKSGVMYALDPESGEIIWQRPVGSGGVLGGIEWGFAADASTAYASLSSALEKKPGEAGGLVAVGISDGKTRWSAPPPTNRCGDRVGCSTAQPAAVTAIPGVIFSGSLHGHLRA